MIVRENAFIHIRYWFSFQVTAESLEQQRIVGSYSATIALSCEGGYRASGTLYLPGDDADLQPGSVTVTVRGNSTVVISSHLTAEFCLYYRTHSYNSSLVQTKLFGISEEVANITSVLTPTGGVPDPPEVLQVGQTLNPPQLLIEKFEMDWCLYEKAELTWSYSDTSEI